MCIRDSCSGLSNIILKDHDGSLFGRMHTVSSNPSMKNNYGDPFICRPRLHGSGIECSTTRYGHLVVESLQKEALNQTELRDVSPLTVYGPNEQENIVTTLARWDSSVNVSTQRFVSTVVLDKHYKLAFNGALPTKIKVQLQGADDRDAVDIHLFFERLEGFRVLHKGVGRKASIRSANTILASMGGEAGDDNPEPIASRRSGMLKAYTEGRCGAYVFDIYRRVLQMKLKGDRDCILSVESRDFVYAVLSFKNDLSTNSTFKRLVKFALEIKERKDFYQTLDPDSPLNSFVILDISPVHQDKNLTISEDVDFEEFHKKMFEQVGCGRSHVEPASNTFDNATNDFSHITRSDVNNTDSENILLPKKPISCSLVDLVIAWEVNGTILSKGDNKALLNHMRTRVITTFTDTNSPFTKVASSFLGAYLKFAPVFERDDNNANLTKSRREWLTKDDLPGHITKAEIEKLELKKKLDAEKNSQVGKLEGFKDNNSLHLFLDSQKSKVKAQEGPTGPNRTLVLIFVAFILCVVLFSIVHTCRRRALEQKRATIELYNRAGFSADPSQGLSHDQLLRGEERSIGTGLLGFSSGSPSRRPTNVSTPLELPPPPSENSQLFIEMFAKGNIDPSRKQQLTRTPKGHEFD
eukprot:TRINITY_DN2746_c0_g1_i1.p1 TRINITY_DN2746_c0_g1~~TRINITY_DN2746_c0_g1_i1.p1  ORF type:complete len:638 (+),score=60.46 TRINITY_DN2746_c0_g1_i1:63-1976(+)